jgi:hypothetical protein
MKIRFLSFFGMLFLTLINTGCQDKKPAYDLNLLYGEWVCTELYQNDEPQSFMAGTIKFQFEPDSVYYYQGGLYKESGRWRLEGKTLITQADGDLEKNVRIDALQEEQMTMMMNDRGIETRMILQPAEDN